MANAAPVRPEIKAAFCAGVIRRHDSTCRRSISGDVSLMDEVGITAAIITARRAPFPMRSR